MKDELDRGEWQGIMASSGGVKEESCKRISLASEGPIYVPPEESMDLSKFLFSFMLLSSVFLSDCIMPRLWRARSRACNPNCGGNPREDFPSVMEDSMSHDRGSPDATPFNWGD